MTERETCGPTWTEALIFEPHAGFGGKDPDGNPWPFGYISTDNPRVPVFELSVIFAFPGQNLRDLANKMAAAPALYAALEEAEACMSIVEPRSNKAEYVRILGVIRAALRSAKGEQ